MLKRIKLVISYDGKNFSGWQVQPNLRTVQGEIIKAIYTSFGVNVDLVGSGRTDAGVSALGQVAHFDIVSSIDASKFSNILNEVLPIDVKILSSEEVDMSFHARFTAKAKTYKYKFYVSPFIIPYYEKIATNVKYKLDIDSMNKAIHYFTGTHDFSAFCSSDTSVNDKIRTIYSVDLSESDGVITFTITGNGFLYNMVRIMVGTIIEVGKGRIDYRMIPKILDSKDRKNAGSTAPAKGLVLWNVHYMD